jgi:hypothetical protein
MNSNKKRYSVLLSSAKSRGLEVNISQIEYDMLINLGCMYCGDELSENKGVGLDRIDSSIGYISSNVTPCCKRCNVAKNDMDICEFLTWVEKIYKFTQNKIKEVSEMDARDMKKKGNIFMNSRSVRNSKKIRYKPDRWL